MATRPPSSDVRATSQRADARRNYERLVNAARDVFAERGVDASLDEIARLAGVGNATLYRHFPTRHALLEAVHRERITALCRLADRLEAAADPAEAMQMWLGAVVDYASASRGLTTALMQSARAPETKSWCWPAMFDAAEKMLSAAKHAGVAPAEVSVDQLLKLVNAISLCTEHEADSGTDARQLLAVVLDGLRYQASVRPGPTRSNRRVFPQATATDLE